MSGRTLRVFAATAALTFLSLAPAAAGLLDGGCCGVAPAAANWGCAPSGCAPLATNFYYTQGCCAPVRWGCGNACGYAYGYGDVEAVSQPLDVMPVHVVPQGPLYSPPLTGYTYPVMRYQRSSMYPYVPGYRPYGYRSFRSGWRSHRVAHYGMRPYWPRHYRGYPLRVRGQVSPDAMWK